MSYRNPTRLSFHRKPANIIDLDPNSNNAKRFTLAGLDGAVDGFGREDG